MKLTLEEIQEVLTKKVQNTSIVEAIIKDLEKIVEDKIEESEGDKLPKVKNEYAIVLIDEADEYKSMAFIGYVVKYKEGDDASLILSKLTNGGRANNETAKGSKFPLKSITDIFEFLKPKFLKLTETGKISILSKVPVRVIISNNKMA